MECAVWVSIFVSRALTWSTSALTLAFTPVASWATVIVAGSSRSWRRAASVRVTPGVMSAKVLDFDVAVSPRSPMLICGVLARGSSRRR